MSISENQFQTWSNVGASTSAENTYNSIKIAIDSIPWKNFVNYEIYLQGSYRNSTNIRGDSDVDIIVEITSFFGYDIDSLSEYAKKEFDDTYPNYNEFTLSGFKEAVFEGLQKYFGAQNVNKGNKAIRVLKGNSDRLKADVLCCKNMRKYKTFTKANTDDYVEGIRFFDEGDKIWVTNYPKLHYNNGTSKNSITDYNFKKIVRIFKNIKSILVDDHKISAVKAPSYFVECLLYNVFYKVFLEDTYNKKFVGCLTDLIESFQNNKVFLCQNEQIPLFGASKQQWNEQEALDYLREVIKFYNEY